MDNERIIKNLALELARMKLRHGTRLRVHARARRPVALTLVVDEKGRRHLTGKIKTRAVKYSGRKLRTEVNDRNIAYAVDAYKAYLEKQGTTYKMTEEVIPKVAEAFGIKKRAVWSALKRFSASS